MAKVRTIHGSDFLEQAADDPVVFPVACGLAR